MIHVYAFAERLQDVPAVAGVDGSALERLRVEDVDAVFSRRDAATSRETLRRDAVAHGAVVDALTARAAAVAPVRLGALLPDEATLAESLRERLPALRRAFDRVRDCVEVAVRVHDRVEEPDLRRASGGDYLRGRAAATSRRRRAVDGSRASRGARARQPARPRTRRRCVPRRRRRDRGRSPRGRRVCLGAPRT